MNKTVLREEALQKAVQLLDITPTKYKQAMERLESMRSYLLQGEYVGSVENPEIYLQGSFKLGTEIRPYKDSKDADYDIDIVCQLGHKKESTTPKIVKHQVGDHLKAHGTYLKMLDREGRRCWTINYAEQDGVGFHMDILPSVQESLNKFSDYCWHRSAIAVTDRCGGVEPYLWSPSNPKGFAEWFFEKNKAAFARLKQAQKQAIFAKYIQEGVFADWSEVPDIHVKTPLQRAIQLLKRHRDISFCDLKNEKYKPISVIITVLAARVFSNETTIYETLRNLIDTLSHHSNQIRPSFRFDEAMAESVYPLITRTSDGKWHIPNPTNHNENFADKWHEQENGISHARAKAFFQWVALAKQDFLNTTERLVEEYYIRLLAPTSNSSNSFPAAQHQVQGLSFNVPHRQKPYWPLDLISWAKISARYKTNGSWKGFNSGDSLDKNSTFSGP
jgi:hypothetical protein